MADGGRVIAGSAGGVRLLAAGPETRALSDRVKESLFGALEAAGVVGPGRAFLDLFAGTGAAGIEALSRGSERATFVESHADAMRAITENLKRAKVAGGSMIRSDVLRFLEQKRARAFDAVFVDPPYGSELLAQALDALAERATDLLSDDAVVVAKHFWREAPAPQIGPLERYRERRFGETMLTFYRLTSGSQRVP